MYKIEWRDFQGKKYKRRLYETETRFTRYWADHVALAKAHFHSQVATYPLITITAYRLIDEVWHEIARYPTAR